MVAERVSSKGQLTPQMLAQSRVIAKGKRIRDVQRFNTYANYEKLKEGSMA